MSSYLETATPEYIESLPLARFKGEAVVIDSKDSGYAKAIGYLSSCKIIGFDTETKPCFKANVQPNHTATLQLSGPDKAFIFRVGQMGLPSSLAALLSSDEHLKIGAAVRDDIKGLQYYKNFKAGGFRDLQHIVQDFGIMEKSVRKMAAIILGIKVSKSQQLSNWNAEMLTPEQVNYAALDAWVCREMYIRLFPSD